MTVIDEVAPPPSTAPAPSTAERRPRRIRALIAWLVIAALVVAVAFVAMSVSASAPGRQGALDPESRSDAGALALAEILRDQGVEVQVFRSRVQASAAIDDRTTLVMANPYTLSDDAITELVDPADRVVFLSSSTHLLDVLDIGASAPGSISAAAPDCSIAEFAEVGEIRPDRLFSPADGVTACFGEEDGAAVLVDDRSDRRHVVVEGSKLFNNAFLAENGNAALALALLGQSDRVVWYVPSFDDSDIEGEQVDTLGSLTPPWLTPVILLLLLSGLAAAIWRGQRFGPLVAETLPVTVRASETMHGRARLTAKAGDAAHAATALREGTHRRLAQRLGLAVQANADEVADAASDRLRAPRGTLQTLLAGELPHDDAGLIDLARRLSELEQAVEASSPHAGGSS